MENSPHLRLLRSGSRAKSAIIPGPQTGVMPEPVVGGFACVLDVVLDAAGVPVGVVLLWFSGLFQVVPVLSLIFSRKTPALSLAY